MRVTIYHSSHYDLAPLPPDIVPTAAEIRAGQVIPGKSGGWVIRTRPKANSHTVVQISEGSLVARLIYELIPRPGHRKMGQCNRKQLVAELLDNNIMPNHAHPKHFTGFDVECDDGPDEQMCRAMLAPYVAGAHHETGEPLIDPADVEAIVAKYMEPTTHEDHKDHLHARFNVAKRAA